MGYVQLFFLHPAIGNYQKKIRKTGQTVKREANFYFLN